MLLVAFVVAAPQGIIGWFQRQEAMSPLLQVAGLGKRFGGFVALDGIDLEVRRGERLGLIGPNGSGKSTLVNCICGTLRNEQGSVRFAEEPMDGLAAHQRTRLGLARSFQLPRPFASLTLAENVRMPILYAVNARRVRASARRGDRRALPRGPGAWSAWPTRPACGRAT